MLALNKPFMRPLAQFKEKGSNSSFWLKVVCRHVARWGLFSLFRRLPNPWHLIGEWIGCERQGGSISLYPF